MRLPLRSADDAPVVTDGRGVTSVARFREQAAALSSQLLSRVGVVNLCEDRRHFLLAFVAALQRRSTTLLPPSRAPVALADVVARYPGCEIVDDARVASAGLAASGHGCLMSDDRVVAIGHTSGSTGAPAAHAKTWGAFRAATDLNAQAIRAAIGDGPMSAVPWIVATVPSQHMYGMETSVLLPLLAGFGIHARKPLLPADVAAALAEIPEPRVLVSTPVHLRALVESGVDFPPVAVIVSATAPLQAALASRVEDRLGATLLEMFGSTETCVIATRRTAREESWTPYPGVRLGPTLAGTTVRAPWLPRVESLQDVLQLGDDGRFTIVGRHSDAIEVAGKRASLADLTRRITSLAGVQDAHVFRPAAQNGAAIPRCAALVVAPGLSAGAILDRLRRELDPAFLPRPLVVVATLPRDEIGKLPLELARALLADAADSTEPGVG